VRHIPAAPHSLVRAGRHRLDAGGPGRIPRNAIRIEGCWFVRGIAFPHEGRSPPRPRLSPRSLTLRLGGGDAPRQCLRRLPLFPPVESWAASKLDVDRGRPSARTGVPKSVRAWRCGSWKRALRSSPAAGSRWNSGRYPRRPSCGIDQGIDQLVQERIRLLCGGCHHAERGVLANSDIEDHGPFGPYERIGDDGIAEGR
jgi:hypothetical protein